MRGQCESEMTEVPNVSSGAAAEGRYFPNIDAERKGENRVLGQC